jgi:hypothetical protein
MIEDDLEMLDDNQKSLQNTQKDEIQLGHLCTDPVLVLPLVYTTIL